MGGAKRDGGGPAGRTDVSGCGCDRRHGAAGGPAAPPAAAGDAGVFCYGGGGIRAACGEARVPVRGRWMRIGGIWRQGRDVPPAHLAAKSPSRGAGTGVCPAVRHPDQERCFRCAHSLPVSVLDRASLEYSGTGPGRGDHGAGSCAGAPRSALFWWAQPCRAS